MATYTDANINNFKGKITIEQVAKLDVDGNGDAVITNGERQLVHDCYVAKFKDHQGSAGAYGEVLFNANHDDTEANKIAAAKTAIKTMEVPEPPLVKGASFTGEVIVVE